MASSNTQVTWTPEVESEPSSSAPELGLLMRFALEYTRWHGYISVVVCGLGIICSLLVIAVLTRRRMLTSSNYMLTALAICDLITMLSYIPYAIQFYCLYRGSSLSTGLYAVPEFALGILDSSLSLRLSWTSLVSWSCLHSSGVNLGFLGLYPIELKRCLTSF